MDTIENNKTRRQLIGAGFAISIALAITFMIVSGVSLTGGYGNDDLMVSNAINNLWSTFNVFMFLPLVIAGVSAIVYVSTPEGQEA